jgi:hypothetical protein
MESAPAPCLQLEGCSSTDVMNIQLSYLPVMDCMNVSLSQMSESFASPSGNGTVRVRLPPLPPPHLPLT